MEAEGDARYAVYRVNNVDAVGQEAVRFHPALAEVLAAAFRVAQHPEFGSVDLDVLASERGKFLRLLVDDFGGVLEKVKRVRISVARIFGRPSERHHQRTWQRNFERVFRSAARVCEFLIGERTRAPNLVDHRVLNLDVDLLRLLVLFMRPLPDAREGRSRLDAGDNVGQRRDKMRAAHLAIGCYVDAARFLQCDRFVNGAILDAFELERGELVRLPIPARLLEVAGPQERTNHFGAVEN